jgi:hypothetical protein
VSPDDPRHGTNAGYVAHMFNKDAPCQRCKDAHAHYKRQLWRRRYTRRADHLYTDATGTKRRIRALIALGWTYRDINSRAGWSTSHSGGNAHNIMRQQRVHLDTADVVRGVYDDLSMTLATGPQSQRQRNIAARKGWLPPLAWDDDYIDDPDYRPTRTASTSSFKADRVDEAVVIRVLSGEFMPTTRAERAEIMRRWVDSGRSERQLAARMGWREGRYHTPNRSVSPQVDACGDPNVRHPAHPDSEADTPDRKAS